MEFAKYSGKTLEEALTNAAQSKGVTAEELTYKVIEEKAGFLGIGKTVEIQAYCRHDISDFISDYIQTFFDNAQMDGSVNVLEDDDDFYRVKVNTNANAVLIGRNGRTLQDFNRLVKAAASAAFKTRVRLLIDVNSYKEERYEKIIKMAMRVAKDVKRSHIDAALVPMPADERKAIHNALSDMPDITTRSQGEGSNRQLCILYTPRKDKK